MPDSVGAVRDPGLLSERLNARIPLIAAVLPEPAITTAETGEAFDNLNSPDVFGHFVAKLTFETQAQGRPVSERQGDAVHLVSEDGLRVEAIDKIDAIIINYSPIGRFFQLLEAMKDNIPGIGLKSRTVEQCAKLYPFPLTDAAPALDAIVLGYLLNGRQSDYEGARQREKVLRNSGARRRKWLTRDWRVSRNGNPFLNAYGYNIVVYPAGRCWGFRIVNRATEQRIVSRKVLATMDAAKLRAFDALIWMKERSD